MNESAARAQRFDSHVAESPCFTWAVPDKPVTVRISLSVVERLEREAVEAFRSVTSRGSEIGGLLIGVVSADGRPTVHIEDYEQVSCDYSRGPLYRLNDADRERLDAAIRRFGAGQNRQVVGFFRSNTRKGMALEAEDVALFSERFAASSQVALLIRPFATKASVGALFVKENGQVNGEAASLEFPFSQAELARRGAGSAAAPQSPESPAPPHPHTAPEAPEAAAPPASPKATARAQIVPIASKREPSAPAPVIEPEPPVEPQAVAPPPPPTIQELAPAPAPPPPVRATITSSSGFLSASEPEPEGRSFGKPLLFIGGGALLLLLVVGFMMYPGLFRKSRPAALSNTASSALSLAVERTGGELLITWNRDSEAVKTATRGVLTISDGPQQQNVELDLGQLRNGKIVYSPVTSDTSFRLDVTSSDAAKNQSESVRVLKTRPSPMAPDATAPPAGEPAAATEGEVAAAPAPAAPRAPLKTFNAPLAQRLRAARPSDIPEPPSIERADNSVSQLGPGIGATAASAPVAPPTAAPAAAAQPAPRFGGSVQSVELLSRTNPVYPPLARQSRIGGVVEVKAVVGPDGKVKEVSVLKGHPLLRNAAMDAVKMWRYKPATLNGQPVESSTIVSLNFVENR